MDLSTWLKLLKSWKQCIETDDCLSEQGTDYAPLRTYEQLLKLHEACRVALLWADLSYPPANRHLLEDYLGSEYVNGYQSASPLELIGDVFYERSYADIQESILSLYALSPSSNTPYVIPPVELRAVLRWILETGWLLLQTDYFPKPWLDADSIDFLRCPVPENQLTYWSPKNISAKERKDLRKTLSKLFNGIDVRRQMYRVEDRLIAYCHAPTAAGMEEDDLETRNLLLKTLDILALIALNLLKRRNRPDGICYPPEREGSSGSVLP